MPQQPKRRMRCCYCGSLKTQKHGRRRIHPVSFDRRSKRTVQRYACGSCGRSFSCRREKHRHYSFAFKKELTRMHVEERLSYRVIAKRVHERFGTRVNASRICQMVNEIARLSKSSVEIQREYHPKWTGYLTVDDKWINVKGIRQLSLVAVDFSGDAVHSELSVEHTQGVYDDFLVYVRDRLGYPFKAITTDFDQRLENAIKRVISPGIAHQQCLWHAEEIVKGLIEYPQTRRRYETLVREVEELKESLADRKQSLYNAHVRLEVLTTTLTVCTQEYREKECLLRQLHAIVFARQAQTSERRWKTFCRVYAQDYAPVVRFIASHWEKLLQHQHDAMIPKTTARAENMNRQLERRLKTIEAFQSPQTAFDYQNLYRNYLRFKPYTDCRGNRKRCNGYSPLQLCGATIMNPDWLANAIRNP